MRAVITPSGLKGTVYAPPSKSYAQRLLICASLCNGISTIKGIAESGDILAALDCIEALGALSERKKDEVTVRGIGGKEKEKRGSGLFLCRESGNTLRFLIPVALCLYKECKFSGTKRLMERGIGVYEELFEKMEILIEKDETSISLKGELKPGDYEIRGDISSQFVTGLLLGLSLLEKDSSLLVKEPVESRPYIDITLDVMKSFGVRILEEKKNHFIVKGGMKYAPADITTEGDWSNAAFLYAFKSLGNNIDIKGLNMESIQGDKICRDYFDAILREEEPCVDIAGCPDLGPVLFAFSAAAGKRVLITGTRRLKIKESDRAQAMSEELRKFGIETEISENSVKTGGEIRAPKEPLYGHNDHRLVMALTLLLSLTGGTIEGIEAVNKTWPGFFDEMKRLGLKISIE